jgi:sodium-dependent dicarboxylate transporter 2/3/5
MSGRRTAAVVDAVAAVAVVLVVPLPGLSPGGRFALATAAFAAVLWVTEGLPLPATALCVPVLLAAFGVAPTATAAFRAFADPVVFLLFAGFVLASALRRHGVDRRLAFRCIVALGTSPRRLVLATMTATAALSMVVSNSATTAMMVPVALGVARAVTGPDPGRESPSNVELALLLGTAYAASIGGVATVIGTPANAIVVSQLDARLGVRIGFLEWFAIGFPLVAVSLPVAWYLLAFRLYPPEDVDPERARAEAKATLARMGPLDAAGRRTVAVTAATAGLWVLGGLDFLLVDALPADWHGTLFGGDASVVGASHSGLLFYGFVGVAAVPTLLALDCIEWEDVEGIDWGTLLLLGGGLALADGLEATDATRWLADVTLGPLGGTHVLLVALAVVTVTVLLSELASNTAVVAVFAPVLIAVGPRYAATLGTTGVGAAAFLAVLGGVAASFGFALPVATPPNAIAYGTGNVSREHMLRAGVRLDALLVLVATAMLFGTFLLLWPVLF